MRAIESSPTQASPQRSKRNRTKLLGVLVLLLLLLGLTFTSVSRFFWSPEPETTTDDRSSAQVEVIETTTDAELSRQNNLIAQLQTQIRSLQGMVTQLETTVQNLEEKETILQETQNDVPPASITHDMYNAYENLEYYDHIDDPATTSLLTRGELNSTFLFKDTKLTQLSDVNGDNLASGKILKWNGSEWVVANDEDSNTTYSAGSGLTLTGTTFKLGGTLDAATSLDLDGFAFTFTDGNVTVDNSLYATALYQNGNVVCDMSGNCGGGGVFTLTLAGDSGVNQTINNNDTITISGGSGLSSVGSATDTVTLNIGAGDGIAVGTNDVSVDESFAFAWTGAQTWSNSADFNGGVSFADTDIALDGASTNLTVTGNFSINTNDIFVQKSDGNVGIGSTSPGYLLDVAGSIGTNDDVYISGIGLNDTASNTTSGAYLIGVFDEFTNSNSTTVQAVLADLDAAISGSGHDPVTLAGAYDYLTLTGQQITLNQIDLTTDVTGILPLANGGTNADLSGVSTGGIIYRGASGLAGSGSLTGVLKGNGSSAPTAMTGTQHYVTRWTDANTLGTGVLYDNATNVGINTTSPGARLDVVGGSIRTDGDIYSGDLYLGYDDATATITTSDTDENLTIDPNGTGSIYLHGATYYIDSNGLYYVNGLATTGFTPTSGEVRANIFRDGDSNYFIQPADTSIAGVFAGNIGIGTTTPDYALQVNGVIAPETTDQDLGTASLRWDLFANTINADSTITFSGLSAGTDDTVITLNGSNQLETREIDPRVWASNLVDGSGTAGYVTYWLDGETLAAEQYLSVTRGGLGNNVTAAGAGEILYSTGTSTYDSLPAGTAGYVLVSTGASAPTWIDSGALGSAYWAKIAGVLSPALAEPIAATSSATTVATFTSNGSNLAAQIGGESAYLAISNAGNAYFVNALGSSIDASGGLTIGGSTQTGLTLGRSGVTTKIANLTTDGVVYTSGTDGTLNSEAQLAIARGGTNSTATPTAGAIAYGTGSAYAFSLAGTSGQVLLSGGAGTPTWGTLGLVYGGTNADLSGVATGGLIYKAASSLAGTGALTGVLKGNGASAPTAMTGTTNYVTRWLDANTLGTGILYDDGTNVGIGTTSPDYELQVNGVIAPETTDQDLGTTSLRWNLFANAIDADSTITLSGLNTGVDNTVLILNGSNQVETREIDPQVWSSDLITGSGTNGYVTYWTGSDTIGAEQYLSTIRGGLGNDVTAAGAGEILYSTGTTTYDSLAAGTNGYVLASGGAGAPTWVDPASLGTNYWQVVNGAMSPRTPYTNNTDLLIGGDATASAKFAVLNVFPGSGTPTASISSGINGSGAYITADGSLATARRQSLTIGNSATYNTSGNVLINSNGIGNVGIGTTAPGSTLDVVSPSGAATIAQFIGQRDANNINVYVRHNSTADLNNSARLTFQLNTDVQQRTAFEFISGFNDIADATRTSYAYFAGQDGGSYGNRMSIVGSNVGIANIAPTARLDITGSASMSGTLSFRGSTDPKIDILNDENFGIRTSPSGLVGLTERLTIINSGNVGIGSTSPSQRLEVGGNIELANFLYFANATSEYLQWDGSNFLLSDDFLPNANDALNLGSDTARWANLFLGGETIHLGDSTTDEGTISYTAGNILSFNTDSTTNGDIAFFTNDLYLDKSEGNVGINTTTPAQTLHVIGDVRISGLTASLPVKTNASNDLISGAINLASAEVTGILPLTNGGTNADLSAAATGSLIYKGASALTASGSLTGVLKGNGSSAPTAMTGTQNYVTRWTDANTLGTGLIYDNGTNVGIGTTSSFSFLLEVAGDIGPETDGFADLGSVSQQWAEIYGVDIYQNGNQVCDTSGNCASVGALWQYNNGAISPATPYTNNSDLLVGSNASASAKFAVLNVFPGSGTPSASVSSGLSGTAMFITADGTLSTENRANLTIGNSSTYNKTGNVLINSNGTGNVGIGTTAPANILDVKIPSGSTQTYGAQISGGGSGTLTFVNGTTVSDEFSPTIDGTSSKTTSSIGLNIIGRPTTDSSGHAGVRISPRTNASAALSGADVLQVYNYTTPLMVVNASGNVGIGSTTPGTKLDVAYTANDGTSGIRVGTAGVSRGYVFADGDLRLGIDNNNDSTTNAFSIYNNGNVANELFRVQENGNVGIGTTGPAQQLHVASGGTRETIPATALFTDTTDTTEGLFIGYNSTSNYGIIAASDLGAAWHNIVINPVAGNVGIGTTNATTITHISSSDGSYLFDGNGGDLSSITNIAAAAAALSIIGSGTNDAGLHLRQNGGGIDWSLFVDQSDSSKFKIERETANILTIDGSGNIGIGTTAPTEKLNVAGMAHITGSGTPTGGVGLELEWDGSQSDILSYNRGTAAFQPLRMRGSTTSLYTGNTEILTVASSTNVGIGDTTPDGKLEVAGQARVSGSDARFVMEPTSGSANLWNLDNSSGTLRFFRENYSATGGGTGGLVRMAIQDNGNVGIGTTTAAKLLDVYGAIRVDRNDDEVALLFEDNSGNNSIYHTVNDGQGNYNIMLGVNDAGTRTVTGDGIAKMLFTGHSTGGEISINAGATGTAGASGTYNIGLSLDSDDQMLRIGNPGDNVGLDGGAGSVIADVNGYLYSERYLYHTGDTNTYLNFPAADTIALNTNGSERLRITSNGNVGIGTTAPGTALDVVGTIRSRAANTQFVLHDTDSGVDEWTITTAESGGTYDLAFVETSTARLRLCEGGQVIVGSSCSINPGRLSVQANVVSDYAAYFENLGNSSNRWGIGIQTGQNSPSTTNYLIRFMDGDATSVGDITFTTGGVITYGTFTGNHNATIPQQYNASGYPYGTLLCLDSATTPNTIGQADYKASRCTQKGQSNIFGVYADKQQDKPNTHTIFAVGDGHVLVTNENGPIKKGDSLVASSTPGYAMKATAAGTIIGTAMSDWSGDNGSTLLPIFYYPGVFYPGPSTAFSSSGELTIASSANTSTYSVTPMNSSPLSNVIGASQAVVGKITAGMINTKELVVTKSAQIADLSVTNLKVSGVSLNQYVKNIVQQELQAQPTALPQDAIAQDFNSGMVIHNYNTTVTIVQNPNASGSATTTTYSATGSGEIANYFNVTEVTEVRSDGRLDILASLISWTDAAADGLRTMIFNTRTQFRYLAWFQGPVKVNADTSGIITIPAETLKARVSYAKPFPESPTVYINFSEGTPVGHTITDSNQTGFTINFNTAPTQDITLQWLAVIRDESEAGPSLEIMETGATLPPATATPAPTPTPAPTTTPSTTPTPSANTTPSPASGSTGLSDLLAPAATPSASPTPTPATSSGTTPTPSPTTTPTPASQSSTATSSAQTP